MNQNEGKLRCGTAFALLVRTPPYQQRSARSQLDVALVAAALETPLQLYFLGHGAMQLIRQRDLKSANLPAGYKAWASLPEMSHVETFIEASWFNRLVGVDLMLNPQALSIKQMRAKWQTCEKVLVL